MKTVILAGGLGTRISEETHLKPKPLIEIGGKPILWHILKIYSNYGLNDFIICCGYKGYLIKEYFANYSLHMSDITFNMVDNSVIVHNKYTEPWNITLVDTGENTNTAGRLLRVKDYLKNEDNFCFTYGDGLSDVNISKLIEFHHKQNVYTTLTAVQPPGRFGSLAFERGKLLSFEEKPKGDHSWINGGFFVLTPKVFDYIKGDQCVWEQYPLKQLCKESKLAAFHHDHFWQPMDTLRDKNYLEDLWKSNKAPWKVWS